MNQKKMNPISSTKLREFQAKIQIHGMTTRFSSCTFEENKVFRTKICKACAYFSPYPIKLPLKAVVIVIEMNNDTNRIEGIGMFRNIPQTKCFQVYSKDVYNRVLYVGNHYKSRHDMTEKDLILIKELEKCCFSGKSHLKRGQGISRFPIRVLFEHPEWILQCMDMLR